MKKLKTHMVIHHSWTRDSGTLSWPVIRRNQIRAGFDDIAYHLGVERFRDRYEMLVGRPLMAKAAGAWQQGLNRAGVHVMFTGNFDLAPPSPEMLRFAAPHLASICEIFGISLDSEFVIPHRQVATYKTCPGLKFDVQTLINLMRGVS